MAGEIYCMTVQRDLSGMNLHKATISMRLKNNCCQTARDCPADRRNNICKSCFRACCVTWHQLPVPFPQAPAFFTGLRQVGALNVQQCQNCFAGNPNVGPAGPSALFALPGLYGLTKFWNFASPQGQPTSIIVTGTAFPTFRETTAGLQCSPSLVKIFNNRLLTSLDGLTNLNTTLRTGPTVQVSGNLLLTSPASVNALTGLAACHVAGQLSPLSSVILIETAQCSMTVGTHPIARPE
jgi:hypothetical protein